MSLILNKENFNNLTNEQKQLYNLINNTIDKYLDEKGVKQDEKGN